MVKVVGDGKGVKMWKGGGRVIRLDEVVEGMGVEGGG